MASAAAPPYAFHSWPSSRAPMVTLIAGSRSALPSCGSPCAKRAAGGAVSCVKPIALANDSISGSKPDSSRTMASSSVARRRTLELGDERVGLDGPLLAQPIERLQRVVRQRILARRPRVQIGRSDEIVLLVGDAREPIERAARFPPALFARQERQLLLQ